MLPPPHTQTRVMALFPGLPGWASTRKVKPIWILLKQETVSGSGIIYTLLQTDNHASTQPLSFLQAGCPSCRPTNSVKAPTAKKCYPISETNMPLTVHLFCNISVKNH